MEIQEEESFDKSEQWYESGRWKIFLMEFCTIVSEESNHRIS